MTIIIRSEICQDCGDREATEIIIDKNGVWFLICDRCLKSTDKNYPYDIEIE
jgi:hypothetical protein